MVALGVGARGRRAGAVSRPLVGITTYAEPVSHGPWRDQPAGGADIDPLRYADIRHPASDAPRSERDDTEIALARRTAELDIPVLGVCRGMQLAEHPWSDVPPNSGSPTSSPTGRDRTRSTWVHVKLWRRL